MNGSFFLDTNILIYTFDHSAPEKRQTAQRLVEEALGSGQGYISTQVVQEFLNLATKRFTVPMSQEDTLQYLHKVLSPLCQVFPNIPLYERALTLQARWRYSFYDSLIIGAALNTRCDTLYSEDLQHGQHIENLIIQNPFLGGPNR